MKWRIGIIASICVAIVAMAVIHIQIFSNKQKGFNVITAFIAKHGERLADRNDVREELADRTGCVVEVEWLKEGGVKRHIDKLIASGLYPDLIDGYEGTAELIRAGAFVPLENYINDYPNIKNYLSEEEWDDLRDEDGHIYIIPQYNIINKEDTSTTFRKGAFWIQKGVLEWAGYPEIKYLKDYFDLIDRYKREHPTFHGESTIGLEIICDEERGINLTNPIQLASGYTSDGCAIVNEDTLEAKIYDFIPQAKVYFELLNQQYWRGVIPSNMFVTSYSDYIELISSGRVLGIIDRYWVFETAQLKLYEQGMYRQTYVPLELALDESVNSIYTSKTKMDPSHGIGITVDCRDVRKVLQFLNELLEPDNMKLRYWGREGIDYMVSENGVFFRTEEQRRNSANIEYRNSHLCKYNFLPHYEGYLEDGINTVLPEDQPEEYKASLCEYDRNFLEAYGYETFMDFLKDVEIDDHVWSKLDTYVMNLDHNTKMGKIMEQIRQERLYWIPQLIMAPEEEFDTIWAQYKDDFYQVIDVETYEQELTKEVHRRVEKSRESK